MPHRRIGVPPITAATTIGVAGGTIDEPGGTPDSKELAGPDTADSTPIPETAAGNAATPALAGGFDRACAAAPRTVVYGPSYGPYGAAGRCRTGTGFRLPHGRLPTDLSSRQRRIRAPAGTASVKIARATMTIEGPGEMSTSAMPAR